MVYQKFYNNQNYIFNIPLQLFFSFDYSNTAHSIVDCFSAEG